MTWGVSRPKATWMSGWWPRGDMGGGMMTLRNKEAWEAGAWLPLEDGQAWGRVGSQAVVLSASRFAKLPLAAVMSP